MEISTDHRGNVQKNLNGSAMIDFEILDELKKQVALLQEISSKLDILSSTNPLPRSEVKSKKKGVK
jgi:hypothetical protein